QPRRDRRLPHNSGAAIHLSAARLLATMAGMSNTDQAYVLARERYAELGVDTERAMTTLRTIPISLHCWQGDDVGGFETAGGELGGGLAVTGNYPGKARNADELRSDLNLAFDLIPGSHRLNLHSLYAEHRGGKVAD